MKDETRHCINIALTKASSLGLGARGVFFGMLRHRGDLVVRESNRQEEGRREAPRKALRGVARLRLVGRLLRARGDLDRAAAGVVEAAAPCAHAERADGVVSLVNLALSRANGLGIL
jgi:hypothetical protein